MADASGGREVVVTQSLGRVPFAPNASAGGPTVAERLIVGWLAAAAFILWVWALREPARVDLAVVNQAACPVWVDVARGDGSSTIDLGPAPAASEQLVREVIDVGPTWRVRFFYAGRLLDERKIDRSDLAAQGWRVTLSPEAGAGAGLDACR
jgi:hypothetical protein